MNCLLDLSFGMLNYGTWGGDLESVLQLLPVKLAGQPSSLLQLDKKTKTHSSNEDVPEGKLFPIERVFFFSPIPWSLMMK